MNSRTVFVPQRIYKTIRQFSTSVAVKPQSNRLFHQRTIASMEKGRGEHAKEKVVIIGTGWGGWTLSQDLDDKKYDITVISPERTLALTPLLASAACGIFDFRQSEEPVRRQKRHLQKYQAIVDNVDFSKQLLSCRTAVSTYGLEYQNDTEFSVPYDKLVLSPGCAPNDFGTPGVKDHAFFLKNAKDAANVRARILDLFELACLPYVSTEKKKELLHIAVVGGGPTGVEMAAEIDDLVNGHLYLIYPECRDLVSITIHDVADKILSGFEAGLSEYALESFEKRDSIKIKVSSHITKIEKDALYTKEEGKIPCGMLVWATGNKQVPLIDNLHEIKKSEKLPRILTDRHLHVFKNPDDTGDSGSAIFENVYALGDAADIEGHELPTTAEVAVQKAKYLCRVLNEGKQEPFAYQQKAMLAYLGRHDGVIGGQTEWSGAAAWLAWRRGSLEWTRSWRRKVMIWTIWAMNYFDGREIARK